MTQRQDHPAAVSRTGRSGPLAVAVATTALMVALLVTACGSAGTPPATGSPAATTAASSTASSTAGGTVPTAASTTASAAPGGSLSVSGSMPGSVPGSASGTTTLVGTVTEGVENGCVVLVDDSGATVADLQGWDLAAHPVGSRVEVTGTYPEGLMTFCQQGRPFTATTVVGR